MSRRVLTLIHDVMPEYRQPVLGTLPAAFEQLGFESQLYCYDDALVPAPAPADFDAVVVTGSPESAYDDSLPWRDAELALLRTAIEAEIPILGVCFGAQILAIALGGSVARSEHPEHGFVTVDTERADLIESGPWLESHFDTITAPAAAQVIATNAAGVQAFIAGPHLGVQFHPEITPAVFDGWHQGFRRRNYYEVDPIKYAETAADIEAHHEHSQAACHRLVGRFLAHAGLTPSTSRT